MVKIPQIAENEISVKTVVEEKCLVAAYKEFYDALKSTKSSHEKKTISDGILKNIPINAVGKWC